MKTSRILVLLLAAWTWVAAPAAPMHFGLFSDAPYSAWEREQFPLLIAEMSAQPLVEYFRPLLGWLEEQNRGRQCG